MTNTSTAIQGHRIPSRALIGFVFLTFAITWGIAGLYIFAPEWAVLRLGAISGSHPFFFLATWSPAISAFLIVLVYGGPLGLKAFLGRLRLWRVSPMWAALVLIGLPLIYMLGSLLKGGPAFAPVPPDGAGAMVALLFMMLFLGPVEEFGWRGVAQPILQRHLAPLWAGAIIGTIWGIWHLPAFYLSGVVYAGWNFLPFFVGNVTLAIVVTPIFNSARGGLIWPMLFHWQLINPFWPDAQPYDTWILVAVAVVIVWRNRETMLTRDTAVTEIIRAG